MRRMNKMLAVILTIIIATGTLPITVFFDLSLIPIASAKSYNTGDIIEYGSYPQTMVTNATIKTQLNQIANTATWYSFGYYSGTGTDYDGEMRPSNCMSYADIISNGIKYRVVKINSYRYSKTSSTAIHESLLYSNDDYDIGINYYFKYEPLKWRVLDANEGFVISESIIDTQPYQNVVYRRGSSNQYNNFYQGKTSDVLANDYAAS